MKFLYNKFKGKKKQIVKVNIDTQTIVKLMTAFDLNKYKNGRTHRYRGGQFIEGQVFFRLPSDGIWYVVVEKGTYQQPKEVKASVELLKPDSSMSESVAIGGAPISAPTSSSDMLDELDEEVEVASEAAELATDEDQEERTDQ